MSRATHTPGSGRRPPRPPWHCGRGAPTAALTALLDGARRLATAGAMTGLLLAATGGGAATIPERFEASYVLSARGLDIGTTRWQLSPLEDGRFVYQSHSEAMGLAKLLRDERIDERSVWKFANGEVRPLHYTYSRSGGKREREVEVRFDWNNGRANNTLNGDSWSMPIARGTLDKLVYLLALMQDLASGVREKHYAVADGGKVKTYRLRVLRTETLDTVLGPLETVVVERTRADDERQTLVWCASALHYLPVRLEHREDDGTLHLNLTDLKGLRAP